ncbi:bifunctional enoyl-CoA hydratase/phosphate acetyltransferase [Chitiniphilus eburneus]|uniref:Bifunctional enoyl-CoA hydratase/phosphate acetyltransferase n=1 Tax=Chitiniphilus eburneus TaxID=2571148 RepID=A0A4V5MRT7_9NEIS|nr:bifunctional enoyl-CoA hydratase/phosphate acetyltransferase [Chitiniphilus eburneus]TJZ77548.1 bifunctional enoyl-CoA hydratase/phosphate acetyltransferase [Chitiniphilus eburneus]
MVHENILFDDIRPGMRYERKHTVRASDITLFGMIAGSRGEGEQRSVPALGAFPLFSSTTTNFFPGNGSILAGHELKSHGWIRESDELTIALEVTEKHEVSKQVQMECRCENQLGEVIASGPIIVVPPTEKRLNRFEEPPQLTLRQHHVFTALRAKAEKFPPVPTAVVHPCDRDSLLGALEAAKAGLITPILVGPEGKILGIAATVGVDLTGIQIVHAEHSHEAADKAVALCRSGEAQALMKGSLHTDEMMRAAMSSSTGLRAGKRVSHVFVMDVPAYGRPLLVTDAAINIAPDLGAKVDITQNAINLAKILGIEEPKVAILSAVETVYEKMPSTFDAALLCKMADRGQIQGGVLDGPLAFDNAISMVAAKTKGIKSPVAGQADILVVPDIESGNMLAKTMSYFAGADSAGIVLGARVPIVLTSRADDVKARLASAAVMALVAHAGRKGD